MDRRTKGPVCSDDFQTSVDGIYSCGNALHVNDLVDYVTESGRMAGYYAAHHDDGRKGSYVGLVPDRTLLYVVPQKLVLDGRKKSVIYFRSSKVLDKSVIQFRAFGEVIYEKKYQRLKPPEMERLEIPLDKFRGSPELINGNGILDRYEDWRLPVEERVAASSTFLSNR